tara:strand:+ start:45 stop:506 length:462 start_codon:yes stop_codon:yes gene_type:complete
VQCYNIAKNRIFYRLNYIFLKGKLMVNSKKRLTHADRVFEYLKNKKQPLSAYDIFEDMRSEGVTAATTIYRALDKLNSLGLVHRIESLNAWTVCCGSHNNKTPVFEICNDCGNVEEHLDQDLTLNIKKLSNKTGFKPDNPVLEIHGQCGDCAS